MSADSEFTLGQNNEGKAAIIWSGNLLGLIVKGRDLLNPIFKPSAAVAGLEGDALRDVSDRALQWMNDQIAKHLGGVKALLDLSQNPHVDGSVRALAVQLADEGGVASRVRLSGALDNLAKESRGAARNGGIVFGALDIFHHAALKPGAAKWRVALMAVRNDKPVLSLPPESAVHLKDWKFLNAMHSYAAGYRRIGNEYLRVDLAERIIKKAHEARGKDMNFAFDMAFVTSLGLGEGAFNTLMVDAGFKKSAPPQAAAEDSMKNESAADKEAAHDTESLLPDEAEPKSESTPIIPADQHAPSAADTVAIEQAIIETLGNDTEMDAAQLTEKNQTEAVIAPIEQQAITYSYWRWKGIRRPKKKVEAAPQTALGAQLAALKNI